MKPILYASEMEYAEGTSPNVAKQRSASLPVFQVPRSVLTQRDARLGRESVSDRGIPEGMTRIIDDYMRGLPGPFGGFRLPTITSSDSSSEEDEDDYVDLNPREDQQDYSEQTLVKLPRRYRLKVWGYAGVDEQGEDDGDDRGEGLEDSVQDRERDLQLAIKWVRQQIVSIYP